MPEGPMPPPPQLPPHNQFPPPPGPLSMSAERFSSNDSIDPPSSIINLTNCRSINNDQSLPLAISSGKYAQHPLHFPAGVGSIELHYETALIHMSDSPTIRADCVSSRCAVIDLVPKSILAAAASRKGMGIRTTETSIVCTEDCQPVFKICG